MFSFHPPPSSFSNKHPNTPWQHQFLHMHIHIACYFSCIDTRPSPVSLAPPDHTPPSPPASPPPPPPAFPPRPPALPPTPPQARARFPPTSPPSSPRAPTPSLPRGTPSAPPHPVAHAPPILPPTEPPSRTAVAASPTPPRESATAPLTPTAMKRPLNETPWVHLPLTTRTAPFPAIPQFTSSAGKLPPTDHSPRRCVATPFPATCNSPAGIAVVPAINTQLDETVTGALHSKRRIPPCSETVGVVNSHCANCATVASQ